MKVVLFCGGLGMRMRSEGSVLPKPMVTVGNRPLIWHVMRYYAHFGHTDFILCLGHGAEHIKRYFLDYQETMSNDFVLTNGAREVELLRTDIADWRITFVDTGTRSSIGERLRRVRHLVAEEEIFLANYADVLTDAPLDQMIKEFRDSPFTASMLAVAPQAAFHCIDLDPESRVTGIRSVDRMPLWMNGGYFILRPDVFEYIPRDGDLVEDACVALSEMGLLTARRYYGFWQSADTVKERNALEEMYVSGHRPWMVWEVEQDASPLDFP